MLCTEREMPLCVCGIHKEIMRKITKDKKPLDGDCIEEGINTTSYFKLFWFGNSKLQSSLGLSPDGDI